MQGRKFYFLAAFIVMFFLSCKKENAFDCVKTSGKTITENREGLNFHTVVIEDKLDVYLKQDNFYVSVTAGKNLIKNIHTEVKNETLYVSNKNKCNFVRDPKRKIQVEIHLPKLKYLKHIGSGNVYSLNTFVQDTMLLRIESPGDVHLQVQTHYFAGSTHGNGDLYISGNTDYFYYNYNGTNYIYASSLNIHTYTYLESHSVGNAYIQLNNIGLDAKLFTDGNIYYTGNPLYVNYISKGKGKVVKK